MLLGLSAAHALEGTHWDGTDDRVQALSPPVPNTYAQRNVAPTKQKSPWRLALHGPPLARLFTLQDRRARNSGYWLPSPGATGAQGCRVRTVAARQQRRRQRDDKALLVATTALSGPARITRICMCPR